MVKGIAVSLVVVATLVHGGDLALEQGLLLALTMVCESLIADFVRAHNSTTNATEMVERLQRLAAAADPERDRWLVVLDPSSVDLQTGHASRAQAFDAARVRSVELDAAEFGRLLAAGAGADRAVARSWASGQSALWAASFTRNEITALVPSPERLALLEEMVGSGWLAPSVSTTSTRRRVGGVRHADLVSIRAATQEDSKESGGFGAFF